MVQRLKVKHTLDIYDFLSRINDQYKDFYITKEKERHFLKNNLYLIEKVLKYQECYGLFNDNLKGILFIVRDKGYRPYVKLLAENSKYTIDLLKYLKWNFLETNLYFKLKKDNPLSRFIFKTGFIKIGDRGREVLFFKKGIKQLHKLTPKDIYLKDEENRLY